MQKPKIDNFRYISKIAIWLTLSLFSFTNLFSQNISEKIKASEVTSETNSTNNELKSKTDSLKYKRETHKKQYPSQAEIKAKIREIDNEIDASYETKEKFTKELEKHYLNYIKKYPSSPLIADAYYNLANITFELYPHEEYNTYVKVINYYQKVLELKPDFKHRDIIYYNLAYCNQQKEEFLIDEKRQKHPELLAELPDSLRLLKKNLKKSIDYYEKIRTEFPNSDLYFESVYRLGDIYFDLASETRSSEKRKKYLLIAKNYYQILTRVQSDLFENTVYKLGWTYFSMNEYTPAIVRFISLLNDITLNDSIVQSATNPEEKEKAKQLLESAKIFKEETLEYVALSFAGYDSTNYSPNPIGTKKFKKIVNKILSKVYAKKILERIGDIYAEVNYPAKAQATYITFLNLFPLYEHNPTIADKIVKSYIKANKPEQAEKEKEDIALRFMASSDWYQKYKNNEKVIKEELPIIKEAYEYTVGNTVNNLIDHKEKSVYNKAIKFSELYLQLFPASEKAQETESNLAQMYFELGDIENDIANYHKAIDKFQELNKKYPNNPNRYINAADVVVAYQSILDITKKEGAKEEKPLIDTLRQDTLISKEEGITKNLLASCDNYRQLFSEKINPTPKDSLTLYKILQLQGNLYYDKNNYNDALPIFKEIIGNFAKKGKKTEYTYKIALCYKNIGDYVFSEEWFRHAERLAVKTNNAEIKKSAGMLALESIQNQALKLEKNSDYIGSAQQYERIAKQDLKANYSFDNMLSAAQLYLKASDFDNAIHTYLFIAESYTDKDKDKQIIPAYYKAASIVDSSLKDYKREINIYQKIVDRYPNSVDSRNAEEQIIAVYDYKLDDKETAAKKYIELAKKYKDWAKAPNMFDNAIFNYQKLGNTDKVIQLCLQFTKIFPEDPSVLNKFQKVLKEYIKMDRWDKTEEIALQIKQKFPEESKIVVGVSRTILNKIEAEADTIYKSKNYAALSDKINEYYNKNNYFIDNDIKLNLDPVYAKLRFYQGEIAYNDLIQDSVKKTVKKWKFDRDVKRLLDKRKKLTEIYSSVQNYNNIKWWTASLHRLGLADEYLFYALDKGIQMFVPVYDEIHQEAFIDAMSSGYINPIYDEMVQFFRSNYNILEKNGIENKWTLASRDKLYEYGIIEKPEKNYESISVITDTSWYYSNIYKEGYSKQDFVDSLSLFSPSKLVSLNNMGIDSLAVNTDAQFIWGSPEDTTLYLRKVFKLNGVPETARLTLISPNNTYVSVNDKLCKEFYTLENEKDWQYGENTDVSDKLNIGKNVITIRAMCSLNDDYKGILADLNITTKVQEKGKATVTIDTTYCTNNNWLVSTEVKDGWYYFDYDDSSWSKASVMQTNALFPLSEFSNNTKIIWDSLTSDTAYFRYKFNSPVTIKLAELTVFIDTLSIYINGNEINNIHKVEPNIENNEPKIFKASDITNFITAGENIIAIKAIASPNVLGMISEIHIVGSKK